ncbi:response regulator [Congregibacter litoralis]|uniref:histidine kinase n=1 Tax=Congregibacter litoralis KT71 TaxID=314285 RepID=A4AB81_9GAMM|nr:response regulator [Congregibacter litoralis]EAQ96635.1 Signal transduction histidine kinase [Congregibacter litoralis KT71]
MKTEPRLTWTQLEKLFTVILCINDDGEIRYASETPRRHLKDLDVGSRFFDLFTLLRPATARSIPEVREHLASLFLVKSRNERFAIRGQMVETTWQREPVLCFCGAPWLFWMNAHCPDIKLGIADFSSQDSQLDQLFLMSTEQRMVSDLEKLNAELQDAKHDTELAQAGKTAMFARMSHEMRTPLNGVVSALALMGDQEMSPQSRELLALANSSSRNLLHVINYVLDISKIESGDEVLENTLFELPLILRSVTDIVRARAVEKKLELTWSSSPLLGNLYLGDKAKLRQCLLNLITNAVKFTPAGSITVRALPSSHSDGNHIRFEVEDTGEGISPEDRLHIFEPFWTGASDALGQDKGTGLGLDLVRRYVEVMQGTLGVISQLGKGSLFWLELPLEPAPEASALGASPEATPEEVPARFQGKVLLVDDNATNMLLGRLILESLGVSVEEARDGAAAVQRALEEDFDLVLMDLNMPVMDGVAATTSIRRERSEEALPVVALTAYASSEERERCLQVGMNDYLTKPIVRDRLAEQLNRWLKADTGTGVTSKAAAKKPPSETNTLPDLAEDVLSELRTQIGDSSLTTVLDQFEAEVQGRWSRYSQALSEGDRPAMIREAHTLSSTCRSLGLANAGEHFSKLESQLQDGAAIPKDAPEESEAILSRGLRALSEFRNS